MSTATRGVWEEVSRIVSEGRTPLITVSPEARVHPAKRPPHAPRFRDERNPCAHYATPVKGYTRPRCLTCKRKLRKHHVAVCSEDCKREALMWLRKQLALLEGRPLKLALTERSAAELKAVGL